MKKGFQKILIVFSCIYIAVTIIFAIVVTALLIDASKKTLQDTSTELITADAHQIELNVNNYLSTVKNVCALLFSDENYYGYYDTNPDLSDYEKIVAKDAILNRIIDLGMMENFADFGIVYPNDKCAGWLSQTTESMFPNGGSYEFFASLITNPISEEAWATGVMGNTDRIYYLKRINPNAVAVLSFYTNEFNSTFTVPYELSEMTVRMTDSNGIIIYSTNKEEVYQELPSDISNMLSGQTGISAFNSDYIVTSNELSNGWNVVCSIPSSSLMEDQVNLSRYIVVSVIVIIVAVVLIEVIVLSKLNSSVKDVVVDLEDKASTDLMTGLLNKASFENLVTKDLSNNDNRSTVFMIMDLDNFKAVNDELGHDIGDEVIKQMSNILSSSFDNNNVRIGRIGGDEFAVCMASTSKHQDQADKWAKESVAKVYDAFNSSFEDKIANQKLSISMGVLVEGAGKFTFEDIYKRTDNALYVSKRNGKNKPTYV